jgi:hypothetical protein
MRAARCGIDWDGWDRALTRQVWRGLGRRQSGDQTAAPIALGTVGQPIGVTVIILPWRVCRDGERNGGGSIRRGDGAILPLSFEIGSGFTKGFKFVLTVLKGSVQRAGVVALGGCTGTGIITVMRVLRAESVWRFNATGVRSAG